MTRIPLPCNMTSFRLDRNFPGWRQSATSWTWALGELRRCVCVSLNLRNGGWTTSRTHRRYVFSAWSSWRNVRNVRFEVPVAGEDSCCGLLGYGQSSSRDRVAPPGAHRPDTRLHVLKTSIWNMKLQQLFCIWGFHDSDYEEYDPLGCNTVQFEKIPTFPRAISSQIISGLDSPIPCFNFQCVVR